MTDVFTFNSIIDDDISPLRFEVKTVNWNVDSVVTINSKFDDDICTIGEVV